MVDLIGIEPMTSSMPWKRAPSCATGPHPGKDKLYSRAWGLPSQTRGWCGACGWRGWAPAGKCWSERDPHRRTRRCDCGHEAKKFVTEMGTNCRAPGVYRCRVSEHSAAGGAVVLAELGAAHRMRRCGDGRCMGFGKASNLKGTRNAGGHHGQS